MALSLASLSRYCTVLPVELAVGVEGTAEATSLAPATWKLAVHCNVLLVAVTVTNRFDLSEPILTLATA